MKFAATVIAALSVMASVAVSQFTFNVGTSGISTTVTSGSSWASYTSTCTGSSTTWCGVGWNQAGAMSGIVAPLCIGSTSTVQWYFSPGEGSITLMPGGINNVTGVTFELGTSKCTVTSTTLTLVVNRTTSALGANLQNSGNPGIPAVTSTDYGWVVAAMGPLIGDVPQHHSSTPGKQLVSLTSLPPADTVGPTAAAPQTAGNGSLHTGAALGCIAFTAILSSILSKLF
eukprot:TRINITY_DN407_c0_g1_i2.p1 TRINITY_DN407_c0_g1~~TRINITY_DN407_c0_g1_i2.p1  ORF type:complete len:229 (+),score=38.67 TRINITY_DN407_c0_g1_i2:56-742(+)